MAKVNINFNSIINKAMHRPLLVNTGSVLYPQLEGYVGSTEGNMSKAQSDPAFIAKSKTDYNSPTNIRRVFITYNKVYTQYYVPYKSTGNNGKSFINKTYEFPNNCLVDNLYEVIGHMLNRQAELQAYMNEKTINKSAMAPDEYVIRGNVFGAFSNSYACNNIEEIYFDWSVFAADELMPLLSKTTFNANNIVKFIHNNSVQLLQDKDTFIKLFTHFNLSGNTKNIQDRFPRLKAIGFISNLEGIFEQGAERVNNGASLLKDIKSSSSYWYELNDALIKASGSCIAINKIRRNVPNKQFRIKDTQYKFDKDMLKPFVLAYQKKVDDYIRKTKYSKGTEAEDDTNAVKKVEITEEENYINTLYESLPVEECEIILKIATSGKGAEEKNNFLVELSEKNRERVAKAIKYNLSNLQS